MQSWSHGLATTASRWLGHGPLGADAVEEDGGRLVGRVLRDELTAEGPLKDRRRGAVRGLLALTVVAGKNGSGGVVSGPADLRARPHEELSDPSHERGHEIAAISALTLDDDLPNRVAGVDRRWNVELGHSFSSLHNLKLLPG